MLTRKELRKIASARLKDAEVLVGSGRYDGALYLCGYAIEMALKARICRTLKWSEYLTSKDYQSFKTHTLEVILKLSGIEKKIKAKYFKDWSVVVS